MPYRHNELAHGRRLSDIIQRQVSVGGSTSEQAGLCRVPLASEQRLDAPVEAVDGLRAIMIPHVQLRSCGRELGFFPMVIDGTERPSALPYLQRLQAQATNEQREQPDRHKFVVQAHTSASWPVCRALAYTQQPQAWRKVNTRIPAAACTGFQLTSSTSSPSGATSACNAHCLM